MGRAIEMEDNLDALTNKVSKIEENIKLIQSVLTTVMNLVDKGDNDKPKKKAKSKSSEGSDGKS